MKVLLYEPYYDRKGHFKEYLNVFRENLVSNGINVYELVGISKYKPNDTFNYFKYYNFNKITRLLSNLLGIRKLKMISNKNSINVIQFLDVEIMILFISVFFNRRFYKNKRIIITQHSANFFVNPKDNFVLYLYRKVTKVAFQYLEKNIDLKVITNGKYIAEQLVKFYSLNKKTVIESWWGAKKNNLLTKQFKENNTFLFFGIIRKDKNIEFLLGSFSKIKGNYKLIIAGYPQDYSKEEIKNLIQKYKIKKENIEFHLKFLKESEIKDILSKSKYIIIPYKKDNVSNSGPLIMGLQFNCIPIVSDYGERGYIVEKYKLGYSFKFTSNCTKLTQILHKCLLDNELHNEKINNILKSKDIFTWDNIIKKLIFNDKIYSIN